MRDKVSDHISSRFIELGISLPSPPEPIASYSPFVISGNTIIISGQVPLDRDGLQFQGKLGRDFDVAEGQAAARLCCLNILAQIEKALDGDFDRVSRIIRLGGFVNCIDDFSGVPQVINGASDLMLEIFGDIGRHARTAVGVNALPAGVAVEIDAIAEFR